MVTNTKAYTVKIFLSVLLSLIAAVAAETDSHPNDNINTDESNAKNKDPCGLWIAHSKKYPGSLSLYTGIALDAGDAVGEPDQLIPIFDVNDKEWHQNPSFHEQAEDDLVLLSDDMVASFVSGVGSVALCSGRSANIIKGSKEDVKAKRTGSAGVHRSRDAAAGSFSYRDGVHFSALDAIPAGSELFLDCPNDEQEIAADGSTPMDQEEVSSLQWLDANGLCVDNILVQESSIPKIGRGAFAKRDIAKGERITTSPTLLFDRIQTHIVAKMFHPVSGEAVNEVVEAEQLLLNYCFEMSDSKALVLPTGPGVTFINHNSQSNAEISWSTSSINHAESLNMPIQDAMRSAGGRLLVEYTATRDIKAGEEIFLNYGDAWEKPWSKHERDWHAGSFEDDATNDANYISAHEYLAKFPSETVRTLGEQRKNSYPGSIRTACYYKHIGGDDNDDGLIEWNEANRGCLRPCDILGREVDGGEVYYSVEVTEIPNLYIPNGCQLPGEDDLWEDGEDGENDEDDEDDDDTLYVNRVPASAVTLLDRPYSTDQLMEASFRYPMFLPHSMVPNAWKREEGDLSGDFVFPSLEPGQISSVNWKRGPKSGDSVAPHAFVIGLPKSLRETMLDYMHHMGILQRYEDLTIRGNSLPPDEEERVTLQGQDWFVQRPDKKWMSNMHWISPRNKESNNDFLTALSAGGFDQILDSVGTHFNLTGLAAYMVTFIGVSHAVRGFMHYDLHSTGHTAYNIIIPLVLANETRPELDLQDSNDIHHVGRFKYMYDVGMMVGDNAFHATSEADYRSSKEMRVAATIYMADISKDNIDSIMKDYTQHYPPPNQPDILLGMSGIHWKRDDPSVSLPKPDNAWLERVAGSRN